MDDKTNVAMLEKTCLNCFHSNCMFYGENRRPFYNGISPKQTNCWDEASKQLAALTGERNG